MPIPVTCPACGTRMKAPDNSAGKSAECRKCKSTFVMAPPVAGESHSPDAESKPPTRTPRPGSRKASAAVTGNQDDPWELDDRPPQRTGRRLRAVGAAVALAFLAVAILFLLKNRRDGHVPDTVGSPPTPPAFDPRDLSRTALWAGNVLAPLETAANTAANIENGIVRADAMKVEAERIKAALGPLTDPLNGLAVSWEVECSVHEKWVYVTSVTLGRDGKAAWSVRGGEANPVAVKLCDSRQPHPERPILWSGENPALRADFISVYVPLGISREEAATLKDRATITARIDEVEVGGYKDEKYATRFVLYLHLSDIKLAPPR